MGIGIDVFRSAVRTGLAVAIVLSDAGIGAHAGVQPASTAVEHTAGPSSGAPAMELAVAVAGATSSRGAAVVDPCLGQVNCGNQQCCPVGNVCVLNGTACCPTAFPYPCPGDLCFNNPQCDPCPGMVDCGNQQCCAAGTVCVLGGTACCPAATPYPCAGNTCSSDPTCGVPLCGDANGDGKVSAADALAALRAAVGGGSCAPARCDYNGDGKVTAADALAILKIAVGGSANPKCPA